eukprot:UN23471
MVKFCGDMSALNGNICIKGSVSREVALLTKEFDGEKTLIKKYMWKLKGRSFVSLYCGRICVGTIMLNILNDEKWELVNAVVDKRARRRGLGKLLAQCAMHLAFNNNCKELVLGAELLEIQDPVTKKFNYQDPKDSGAARFWKNKMKFKQISLKEYNKILKDDLEGIVPMKMTKNMKAVRELPGLEDLIAAAFPKLNKISKAMDGKKRAAMIRLCSPKMGDVKIVQTRGQRH